MMDNLLKITSDLSSWAALLPSFRALSYKQIR